MTPALTVDDLEMLDSVIDAYCQRNSTGGSLHIVLDDGNWNRMSIEFCLEYARDRDDPIGEAISKLLLRAPDNVIQECKELGWYFGLTLWQAEVRNNS